MILNQVKYFICRGMLHNVSRFMHQGKLQSNNILHPLESRNLVKISGEDVSGFLQGLITNDMRHFQDGARSIYTMFLNTKGRVLYDTLIHKYGDKDAYLIECDKTISNVLQKHLKVFKLRRKIDIADISNEVRVWALTCPLGSTTHLNVSDAISLYKDPRLVNLGYRVITSRELEGTTVAKSFGESTLVCDNEDNYKYLRYELGVSEGVEDLPPGTSFPLEANCDYLHGVSFHKGCYVGQELTARVHHTGVVRKRLMPLQFIGNLPDTIQADTVISVYNNPKSSVGKVKGIIRDLGLGLVRIKEAMAAETLIIGSYKAVIIKPTWWPVEAPKDKLNVSKVE